MMLFLTEVSIVDSLDSNLYCDPNENYNIRHETLTKLKDKHLPISSSSSTNIDIKIINGLLMVL